ncbi:MAG: phospholipase D family protein [Luteimonas sp.]
MKTADTAGQDTGAWAQRQPAAGPATVGRTADSPRRTLLPALLSCLLVAAGCARLPPRPVLPVETAITGTVDTALDRRIQPMTAAHPGYSGFRLVSDGPFAFALRAALVRNAQRSLDLQYYIWHSDVTGRLLAREVLAAADRGVHVRLLLDDLDARSRDFWLAAADAHPNIEVRLFNPFAARRGPLRKIGEMLTAYSRINHRMHNKNLIADNRVAISGGRNIGDEYFSASKESNFTDLDLAVAGPVVTDLSRTFDRYWNSEAVWPIAALLPDHARPEDLVALRDGLERHAQDPEAQRWLATLPGNAAVAAFVAGEMPLHWTERWRVLADDPLKARLGDAAHTRSEVLRGLSQAMRESNTRVVLISPYFVPGDRGAQSLADLAGSGRSVTVLTNSLAANDVAAVYSGYARYRTRLLQAGVHAYELKPDPGHAGDVSIAGSSGASLHSKAVLIDGDETFVGSFNLDPRSVSLNSEQGVLVTDAALAEELAAYFQRMTASVHSWRVDLDARGDTRWTDASGSTTKTPASFGRRTRAAIGRMLPIESQL